MFVAYRMIQYTKRAVIFLMVLPGPGSELFDSWFTARSSRIGPRVVNIYAWETMLTRLRAKYLRNRAVSSI